jgi:hypothetical protein
VNQANEGQLQVSRLHVFKRTQVMKRIVIGLVAVAVFAVSGIFANTAQAIHPYRHHHHHHHCPPRVSVGYGGYVPYGGYAPYGVYRPVVVPYGVGYAGGWQPYQGIVVQQPRFGLSIGF